MIPVYEMLSNTSSNEDLDIEEKETFINNIKNINQTGHDLIYVIIKAYESENTNEKKMYPYGGKMLKTGLKFDLDSFDNKLKQILFRFIKLHMDTQSKRDD